MVIDKWYESAVLGITVGILVGLLSQWQSNVILGVVSLVAWLVLMFGYPRGKHIWRKNLFWISAFCLPVSWGIYVTLK